MSHSSTSSVVVGILPAVDADQGPKVSRTEARVALLAQLASVVSDHATAEQAKSLYLHLSSLRYCRKRGDEVMAAAAEALVATASPHPQTCSDGADGSRHEAAQLREEDTEHKD